MSNVKNWKHLITLKAEVLHAVFVCIVKKLAMASLKSTPPPPPPLLTPEEDVNNEAIVTRETTLHGNWVWNPQAAGSKNKRLPDQNVFPKFRR